MVPAVGIKTRERGEWERGKGEEEGVEERWEQKIGEHKHCRDLGARAKQGRMDREELQQGRMDREELQQGGSTI